MDKVYVIMLESDIWESAFYTDENKVSERVESLRKAFGNKYWYTTLIKR